MTDMQPTTDNDPDNTLYIVCGRPGVGKTTYARQLAQTHSAVLLDIDTVTEPVVQAGLQLAQHNQNDRDSLAFKSAFRQPIHDALFATAKDNLSVNSVVIAAPFTREISQADWLDRLKESLWPATQVHYLICNEQQIRERLVNRGKRRDGDKIDNWEKYTAGYSLSFPAFHHILIDTTN